MMKKNKIATSIINTIFSESQTVRSTNITSISNMEIAAVMTGLTAFFVAGFRNDFDLCQELTPVYQMRIMPTVSREEYDNLTQLLNNSYIRFREIAIRVQDSSPDWITRLIDEFASMFLELIRAINTDSSRTYIIEETKKLLDIACTTGNKHRRNREVDKSPENKTTSMLFGRTSIPLFVSAVIILALILFSIVMMVIYNRLSSENAANVQKLSSYENESSELSTRLDETQKKLDQLETQNQDLNERLQYFSDKNKELINESGELRQGVRAYSDLQTMLNSAKTSNGIISVSNKVYAVKKGSSDTIKVSWPAYETSMYMGANNASIANAEWSNNNVRITGISKGVTTIQFGSDSQCTKDRFVVVVICYE